MKITWQSAERQVFRQLNFSNIRRETIIEALLQRFEDSYPVNFEVTEIPLQLQDYRGISVFSDQNRPRNLVLLH